jgi:hypothetical protein
MATEPDGRDFDLIPPDPGLINPDLALDAALAPVEDDQPDAPLPFGRSWRFDFIAGQFVREGTVPQVTYELDSFVGWVEKTLRTAQQAHPIYSDSYGVDQPGVIGEMASDELLGDYQDAAIEALMVHDRVVSVEEFSFNQDPFDEGLYVSFTVMLDAAPALEPQPLEFTNVPLT